MDASGATVRQRRRGADGVPVIVPAHCEAQRASGHAPDNERLRAVLVMAMEHRSQAEIAAHFRVSVRTVRRWLREAQRRRLIAFQGTTPEELLARTDHMHAILQAGLLERFNKARFGGDAKAMAICARELRGIERDRYLIREMVGYFDGVQVRRLSGDEDDLHTRGAHVILSAIHATFFDGPEKGAAIFKLDGPRNAEDDPFF